MKDEQTNWRYDLAIAYLLHDLHGPLNGLRTKADILRKRVSVDNFDAKELHSEVADIASMAALCIHTLRNLETLIPHARSIDLEYCEVEEALIEAAEAVRASLRNKSFMPESITIDCGYSVPRVAFVRNQLVQVFINMLEAAIIIAKPNPELFNVSITAYAVTPDSVTIEFRDCGWGIWTKDQYEVFNSPLTTKSLKGNPKYSTRLWIVSRILGCNKATIRLSNQSDPTQFTITIPAAPHSLIGRG